MTSELKREYEIGPEIGRGRFGTVYRCRSVNGAAYAVKSIDKSALTDPTDLRSVLNEAKLTHLAAAGNPNVVGIHAVYEDAEFIHLVLDLCVGPDLFDRVSAGAPFLEAEAAGIRRQLTEAIAVCHRRGIVHREVKPDNVMFDEQDRLKLVDFGSAEVFRDGRMMSGIVGTPYYVAPEVLAGREYNEKVDVWSAGVILYVMLSGIVPFYGEMAVEIFNKVIRGNLRFPMGVFREVSPAAKDLMRRMMCKDVDRRLSAEQVLRDAESIWKIEKLRSKALKKHTLASGFSCVKFTCNCMPASTALQSVKSPGAYVVPELIFGAYFAVYEKMGMCPCMIECDWYPYQFFLNVNLNF